MRFIRAITAVVAVLVLTTTGLDFLMTVTRWFVADVEAFVQMIREAGVQ